MQNKSKRHKAFIIFGGIVAVLAAAVGIWWVLVGSHVETTDDAYVEAEVAQVTPTVDGIISKILVQDTQIVKAGDLLVELDNSDMQIALTQARASVKQADSALNRAKVEYGRRQGLGPSGAIAEEEITTAQANFLAAEADFEAAKARADQAEINLARTSINSPLDGVVAKRSIQLGQHVNAGSPMMTIVPLADVFVTANFKEVQLRKVKIGQPVTLTADLYGDNVTYHGKVAGVAGGTGSAFAAIPAQNATGNWIKVVQRLPVKITLDADEIKEHPLQMGLSMEASIDISQ